MRALVIDDSKPIRMILTKILTEIGFEVEQASNGFEAMDVLKKEKVDIALVDWNMPEMNGYEFVKAVRKDNTCKKMLLMMVTTETAITQVAAALEAGVDEYVMKPFTKDMIVEKLALMGIDTSKKAE